jgi:hypothetical protein
MIPSNKPAYFLSVLHKLKQVTENDVNLWDTYISNKYSTTIHDIDMEKEIFIPHIRLNGIIRQPVYPFDNYEPEQKYPCIYSDSHLEICVCEPLYFPFIGSIVIREVKKGFCLTDEDIVLKTYNQTCWFWGNRIFFDKVTLMKNLSDFLRQFVMEIGV